MYVSGWGRVTEERFVESAHSVFAVSPTFSDGGRVVQIVAERVDQRLKNVQGASVMSTSLESVNCGFESRQGERFFGALKIAMHCYPKRCCTYLRSINGKHR
jgi:hypothetical protein